MVTGNMTKAPRDDIAIIAVGRNEGDRLKSCLRSCISTVKTVIYVDSGSTDGSSEFAAALGASVVELDASRRMCAARARNEGFSYLMKVDAQVPFVQFLDGDCDLDAGWLDKGVAALQEHPEVGIVCGQVRELHAEATAYNTLADLQWQQRPGLVQFSGGRFLIRTPIFEAAGEFLPEMIAGEDDEFNIRVLNLGWKILQLDADMARHDIAMTRFSEYWRRARRTGHAYANVAALHNTREKTYYSREFRRIVVWGFVLPLLALCLVPFTRGLSVPAVVGLYALQFVHNYLDGRRRGWNPRESLISAWFNGIFKFPAFLGLIEFHWRNWRGKSFRLIEYRKS